MDPPKLWISVTAAKNDFQNFFSDENAAIYFPRVKIKENSNFVPCGIIAGIIARTDNTKGVWKAPTGIEATITGILEFTIELSDEEIGILNPSE